MVEASYAYSSLPFLHSQGFFQSIDELQNHGINAADISKLKAAGIATVKV